VAWFLIYALTKLYQMPVFIKIPTQTALSNFVAASLYGLVLAGVLELVFRYQTQKDIKKID
jgi:hypothetical protein